MKICTIAAKNYLAQVKVLAASFKSHHPDGEVVVLYIADKPVTDKTIAGPHCQVIGIHDIGLPPDEIGRMAMIYNVTEFCTAVKPWLLQHLLATGSSEVMYLDPDIEIFAPLDELFELARRHDIVLTPHCTSPIPDDGLKMEETDILSAGVYNLGFLAVGQGSGSFLEWWSGKLRRECRIDMPRMRFTDQRWVDFVPSMFGHYILKDAGCNVAYWNLHSRKVRWTGACYEVNGGPLRFFHYSGYDPGEPHILSKHTADRPRILLSQEPGVARLCREYASKLEGAGFSTQRGTPYCFDTLGNGFRVTPQLRQFYREILISAEAHPGEELPPVPYAPDGGEAFVSWLNEPVFAGRPDFTRYLGHIYESRIDVQQAFPSPAGTDSEKFRSWVLTNGRAEHDIPEELLPRGCVPETNPLQKVAPPRRMVPSIDIAGYLNAELGVGEAARLLISGMEAAGIPYNSIICRETSSRQNHPFQKTGTADSGARFKILCINGDRVPGFARQMNSDFFRGRHTIGVWFWEIEQVPPSMFPGFQFVDEIWAASSFIAGALQKVSPVPIFSFPLPVPRLPALPSISKKELGIPEGFVFLFVFDFFSIVERKNPLGLIHAFKKAFSVGEGPILLIKSINGDRNLPALEKLRHAAEDRDDIVIMDRYLAHDHKDALIAHCDCYVSLHRAEGFGLTIAEAMSLAKPVISTRYGGNLDFMTEQNSYLCSWRRRRVGEGNLPYPADAEWAEPDVTEAAALMRHIHGNPAEAAARGERARRDIEAKHSFEACGRFVSDRLAQIDKTRYAGNGQFLPSPARVGGGLSGIFNQAQEVLKNTFRYWRKSGTQ